MPEYAYVIIGCVLLILWIIWQVRRESKQRRQFMVDFAEQNQLHHFSTGGLDLAERFQHLPLFRRGTATEISNYLTSQNNMLKIHFFDYSFKKFEFPAMKEGHFSVTVLIFEDQSAVFPKCKVWPKRWYHRFSFLWMRQFSDLSLEPDFSRRFNLATNNPRELAKIFDSDLQITFVQSSFQHLELGGNLAMLHCDEVISKANLQPCYDQALNLFRQLIANAPPGENNDLNGEQPD